MLHEYISVAGIPPNELIKYFCNFLLIMWTLLGEDIFLHFQILLKILVKYLDSSLFQVSNKYSLHCKPGSTKYFLTCISKTYTYKRQDCSTIRKTKAFIYAWGLVAFKKFQNSPKQQECSISELRTKNISHFTLNWALDRVIWLLFPFAQTSTFGSVSSDYQCQLSR